MNEPIASSIEQAAQRPAAPSSRVPELEAQLSATEARLTTAQLQLSETKAQLAERNRRLQQLYNLTERQRVWLLACASSVPYRAANLAVRLKHAIFGSARDRKDFSAWLRLRGKQTPTSQYAYLKQCIDICDMQHGLIEQPAHTPTPAVPTGEASIAEKLSAIIGNYTGRFMCYWKNAAPDGTQIIPEHVFATARALGQIQLLCLLEATSAADAPNVRQLSVNCWAIDGDISKIVPALADAFDKELISVDDRATSAEALLATLPNRARQAEDILLFPAADWGDGSGDAPELAKALAASGYRVFYFDTDASAPHGMMRDCGVQVCHLSTGCSIPNVYRMQTDKQAQYLLWQAEALVERKGIQRAAMVVMHAAWAPVVNALREAHGFRVAPDVLDAASDGSARMRRLQSALYRPVPKVSVIILTWNNADYSIACIDSVLLQSCYPNLEVIVVDNHSTDDTVARVRALQAVYPTLILIENAENLGFAAGNNVGIRAASGEYIVILNNDTVVTPGWIAGMQQYFADKSARIGMVGATTNAIGNEARVQHPHASMAELNDMAARRARIYRGQCFDIPVLALFCTMIPRWVIERVGLLDEAFQVGMFEDDDYAKRVQDAGLRTVCAKDVYIHHYGKSSFKLLSDAAYSDIFAANMAVFNGKHDAKWQPPERGHIE